MLQWNDLHPYNAVHVVRIRGDFRAPALQAAVEAVLNIYGIGTLELNRDKGTFHYQCNHISCAPAAIAVGENPQETLRAEIDRQLNTPFPKQGPFSPFRFFVVPEPSSFSLGCAYFHPAADAVSIVYLLKAMAECYQNVEAPRSARAIALYPASRDRLILRHPALLFRKVVASYLTARNLRRSLRPPSRDPQNTYNHCDFFSLPADSLSRLTHVAKSHDVTLNDLFLAALLLIVAPFASRRVRSPKRRWLSAGCIVNLRGDLELDSRTFGLFLGSFTITHEVPEGITLLQLARAIRVQTAAVKKHRLFLGTAIEMTFARALLSFFSTERRKKLYQKHYPLWGGITNMNLNSLWQQAGDKPVDYFRAVSTGPVTPLVLSITTVNDKMNVSITSRANVFSKTDMEQLKQAFLHTMNQLEVSA